MWCVIIVFVRGREHDGVDEEISMEVCMGRRVIVINFWLDLYVFTARLLYKATHLYAFAADHRVMHWESIHREIIA